MGTCFHEEHRLGVGENVFKMGLESNADKVATNGSGKAPDHFANYSKNPGRLLCTRGRREERSYTIMVSPIEGNEVTREERREVRAI